MKCPRCGHWNKPSFPHCFRCGEPLNARAQLDPEWQRQFDLPAAKTQRVVYDDTQPPVEDLVEEPQQKRRRQTPEKLAKEMTELKDRRARGSAYLEEFRKNAVSEGLAPSSGVVSQGRASSLLGDVPDDPSITLHAVEADSLPPENTPFDIAAIRAARKTSSARVRASEITPPDAAIDPAYADLPPAPDMPLPLAPSGKRKRKLRRVRGPMLIALILVILLGAGVLGLGVYASISYIFPTLLTGRNAAETVENYTLTPIELDGLNAHRLVIPGEEGTQVYIAELTRTFVVSGGAATIDIPDHIFYDTIEPLGKDMETMDVSLTPTLVRSGVETRMQPIYYTIDIPLSPIVLINPETQGVTVNASIINMRLNVAPGSRITVNGRDVSDSLNDEGEVSFSHAIQAIGNNHIAITVRAPYSRENSLTVTVYRAPTEIPLELNPATLIRSSTQQFTIYGTTQRGATITCETPYFSMDTTALEDTGAFSVATKMSRVGYNTIRIRASYPGKADAILEHTVYYLPPAAEYTPRAWALSSSDYSELMNNIDLRVKNAQIYLCQGEIVKLLSANPQLAIINTGTADKEQLVMLENRSGETWELGKIYRVYADVSGVYNNMPRMVGRYTYPPPEKKN